MFSEHYEIGFEDPDFESGDHGFDDDYQTPVEGPVPWAGPVVEGPMLAPVMIPSVEGPDPFYGNPTFLVSPRGVCESRETAVKKNHPEYFWQPPKRDKGWLRRLFG